MSTTALIAPHVMTELLQVEDLLPMRRNTVMGSLINESDITGEPSGKRSIPARKRLAEATDKLEGVAIGAGDNYEMEANIEIVPTDREQAVPFTVDALTLKMPGADHLAIIEAIKANRPEIIAPLRDVLVELADAHARRDERDMLALAPLVTASAGTTNTQIDFAKFLTGFMNVVDQDPDSQDLWATLTSHAITTLRTALITGTGTGLANIWNDSDNITFFRNNPQASKDGFYGAIMGVPIYRPSTDLVPLANAGVDAVTMIGVFGSGRTGAAGSRRGFAERCFGSQVRVHVDYDGEADVTKTYMRVKVGHKITTQAHASKLIYKKD